MKNLYDQYIKIPENKKISDSVFRSRIILSVISILACLAIMFSTAFAFFSADLTKKFKMTAAEWDVCAEEIANENEVHTFRLFRSPNATATKGYCIVIIKEKGNEKISEEYCTDAFSNSMILNIQVTDEYYAIFVPRWGDPREYGIEPTRIYGYGETIDHSHTEITSPEDDEMSETSESIGSEEAASGDSGGTESSELDASPDKPEASEGTTESSDSGESSDESTEDSSEEGSSEASDEGSSSTESMENTESGKETENNTTGESGEVTETTGTSEQASGDVDSSPSAGKPTADSSLLSDGSSAAGGESASGNSSVPDGGLASDSTSSSNSGEPSVGVESSSESSAQPSGDDGTSE